MRRLTLNLLFLWAVFINTTYAQVTCPTEIERYRQNPTAVGLGNYGKFPVSHYTGQADVSIPLRDFNYKDITIPLTLRYNTQGNRVNDHPSQVGLGWTLEAGGSITRIVKGLPDEISKGQISQQYGLGLTNDVGYYYRSKDIINNTNWASEASIKTYGFKLGDFYIYDAEPDEFVFNFCGIRGSFYLNGNGVKINNRNISTTSNDIFDVEVEVCNDNVSIVTIFKDKDLPESSSNGIDQRLFRHFKKFTVILKNGDRITFGGNESAIDYTTSVSLGTDPYKMMTQPTSWHIVSYEKPEGTKVNFEYSKFGDPYIAGINYYFDGWVLKNSSTVGHATDYNYRNSETITFLHQSHLKKITCNQSDNWVSFNYDESVQLGYDLTYNHTEIIRKVTNIFHELGRYSSIPNSNYWMQLGFISYSNKIFYNFDYTTSTTERLKLLGISLGNYDNIGNSVGYNFDYYTNNLPNYNVRRTDNWGYYNDILYDELDILCTSLNCSSNLYNIRKARLPYAYAEMLKTITFPTGGSSSFEYELNKYSKVLKTYPNYELKNEIGEGAGLRVSKITSKAIKSPDVIYNYKYLNKDQTSSGILSGVAINSYQGKLRQVFHNSGWSGLLYYSMSADYQYNYYFSAENNLTGLQTDLGRITYSRVEEIVSGNGKTVYYYTNHDKYLDEAPVTAYTNGDNLLFNDANSSRELERGALYLTEFFNETGGKVKKINNIYRSDNQRYNEYVRSVRLFQHGIGSTNLLRFNAYKIYSFKPRMEKQEVVEYYNSDSVKTTTSFKYDEFGNIKQKTDVQNDGIEYNTYNIYSGNLTTSKVYTQLSSNFLACKNQASENLQQCRSMQCNYMTRTAAISDECETICMENYNYDIESCNSNYQNNLSLANYYLNLYGSVFDLMYTKGMVSLPVESINTIRRGTDAESLISGVLTKYKQYGTTIIKPWEVYKISTIQPITPFASAGYNSLGQFIYNSKYERVSTFSYDDQGNIVQEQKENNFPNAFIWGYKKSLPVAAVNNSKNTETYYEGFEDKPTMEGWESYGYSNFSRTGTVSLRIDKPTQGEAYFFGPYLDINNTTTKKYRYSGWVYSQGPSAQLFFFMKPNTDSDRYSAGWQAFDLYCTKTNEWVYVEGEIAVPSSMKRIYLRVDNNGGGTVFFDDLRLAPSDAQMESYTYDPLYGITSKTDPNNVTTYFAYDGLGRLSTVKDSKANPLKQYYYHYDGQDILDDVFRCKVEFNTQGGNSISGIFVLKESLIGAPATPTRTGYTFNGWFKESACTTPWNFSVDKVMDNITLYAKWTVKTYTISATASGGGSVSPSGTATVNYGGAATYTFTPNSGFVVKDVKINGSSIGAQTTYTFSNVSSNQTLYVEFGIANSVSPTSLFFDAIAVSQTVNISSVSSWTAIKSASWITVTPTTGTGNGTISIRPAKNLGVPRSGSVTIDFGNSTQVINIEQDSNMILPE